jgi:hypothetical protein
VVRGGQRSCAAAFGSAPESLGRVVVRRRMTKDRRACDCRRRTAPTDRQAASHEVWICSLQRSPAAPYRPWPTRPRAIPLRRLAISAPTPFSPRPCGF